MACLDYHHNKLPYHSHTSPVRHCNATINHVAPTAYPIRCKYTFAKSGDRTPPCSVPHDQMAMSKTAKNALKSVNIFVEWEREKRGAAVYHPNAEWLARNGWLAEKHETVNIVNISNWTSANQPYMVLHELAHAYHNKVLGDDNSEVLNAFSQAIESKFSSDYNLCLASCNVAAGVPASFATCKP